MYNLEYSNKIQYNGLAIWLSTELQTYVVATDRIGVAYANFTYFLCECFDNWP